MLFIVKRYLRYTFANLMNLNFCGMKGLRMGINHFGFVWL